MFHFTPNVIDLVVLVKNDIICNLLISRIYLDKRCLAAVESSY